MSDSSLDVFEAEVRAFLDANATKKTDTGEEKFVWGEGSDKVAMFEEVDPEQEKRRLAEAKAWRATRFDNGFAFITGPAESGGRELSQNHQRLYDKLEGEYETPGMGFFGIGLGMVAPTIAATGQDATKAYLPAMYRGDIVGAQLFSEPGAGSDLASLQLKAERDGDEWILNGQKVWTSGAQYSDIGEVIARTDPDLPKHRGLTGFVVDMHGAGVEVRPLRQMTGGASFNEVFFNDCRVPDDHRLGDVNGGWSVALTTLMNERASIGGGGGGGGGATSLTRLVGLVNHLGLADDPIVRQKLMDIHINGTVSRLNSQRAMDKVKSGQLPGPEMSIGKLSLTENLTRVSQFVTELLGARAIADTGEWGTYAWTEFVLGTPGMRIAGGSDEVMRNIVGERVLGLPKEPGIDTTSPFKDLKVGTQTRD